MKKNKLINKKLMVLLVFSLSIFIFAGCQTKAATNNSNTGNHKSFNSDAMKKKMQDSINPLVVNKTLTQVQEDKIVAALTTTNTKRNNTNKNSQSKNSGQASGANGNKSNRQEVTLTKLVTDKVITKAQADAVTKVIKVNTTRPQNNKPSGT
jgi:hypothetical protein